MVSRRKAGEAAGSRAPSRRALILGASVAPWVAGWTNGDAVAAHALDPAFNICQRWLAIDAERQQLLSLWDDIEARLMNEHGWDRRSTAEPRVLPDDHRLSEIDARLDVLFQEDQALLEALPSAPATSVAAVIAKLGVAERVILVADPPLVRDLIVQSIRDLTILNGAG